MTTISSKYFGESQYRQAKITPIGNKRRVPVIARYVHPILIELATVKDEARLGDINRLIAVNCPHKTKLTAYNVLKDIYSIIKP